MSYLVLARRYRPQVFGDLVGQDHVSQTLRNALKQNRAHHAYLFTGPRGVGKTSAARLLAKALRCLNPRPDCDPCNECEACKSINDGTSLDVLEIDAASNTGVDNIRDLREGVGYAAAVGKYRVYIIDEVHMLSTAAFNALLKTLEEPPENVVFIFATTELHKVPLTVKGRCQTFDFKRIPANVIADNLREICKLEGVTIDDAALQVITTECEGCLRDAQSLLDRSIALCGSNIRIEVLEQSLGMLDRASYFSLLEAVGAHDPSAALKVCALLSERGVEARVLLARLVESIRQLHYLHFTGQTLVSDAEAEKVLQKLSKQLSSDEIVRALDLAVRVQTQLPSFVNAQVAFESMIVKLCLQRPVGAAASTATTQQTSAAKTAAPPPARRFEGNSSSPAPAAPPAPSAPVSPSVAGAEFSKLDSYIRSVKPAWTPVLNSILGIAAHENGLKLRAKNDFGGKRLRTPEGVELLKTALGVKHMVVDLESVQSEVQAAPVLSHEQRVAEKRTQAKEHEAVKSALKIFDAVITNTKIVDE